MSKIIKNWGIEKKAAAIVTDNAANIVVAVSRVDNEGMPTRQLACLTHIL
jgi:hypothetical protein